MAELILTDEERAALTWLDLSDDALGKLCRKTCLVLPEMPNDSEKCKPVWAFNAAMLLCNLAAEANSTETRFQIEGLTHGDQQHGDWTVTIRRRKPRKPKQS